MLESLHFLPLFLFFIGTLLSLLVEAVVFPWVLLVARLELSSAIRSR